jgi:hypothetical protein
MTHTCIHLLRGCIVWGCRQCSISPPQLSTYHHGFPKRQLHPQQNTCVSPRTPFHLFNLHVKRSSPISHCKPLGYVPVYRCWPYWESKWKFQLQIIILAWGLFISGRCVLFQGLWVRGHLFRMAREADLARLIPRAEGAQSHWRATIILGCPKMKITK